ncbi:hypothetical protein AB0A63_36270 [Lentzea sp. NPDC042327]|uniref:hypothetical protein n=1 Tax=Lentzea sp. NPDC042327 TaxID=3154801 RepID=UPI0033C401BD
MADQNSAGESAQAYASGLYIEHDPQAVDKAIGKLDDLQRTLERIKRRSSLLATRTPLGGGYAQAVGSINERVGELARSTVIPGLLRVIDELRAELDKSSRSYRNVEESTSDTLNRL